jgi:hypothetical protein
MPTPTQRRNYWLTASFFAGALLLALVGLAADRDGAAWAGVGLMGAAGVVVAVHLGRRDGAAPPEPTCPGCACARKADPGYPRIAR